MNEAEKKLFTDLLDCARRSYTLLDEPFFTEQEIDEKAYPEYPDAEWSDSIKAANEYATKELGWVPKYKR